MTDPASIEPAVSSPAAGEAPAWRIRQASADDAAAVAAAVGDLLVELGGRRPSEEALEAEARTLLGDPREGVGFVAEAGERIVGVLVASWLRAMHVPGRYALIQDLWVDPDWRSRRIGADLVAALAAFAREQQVTRIEVGLPRESFAGIGATVGFYAGNDFESLGIRMRLDL
jgi:GNAT superfamily N-acetyltransferase